MSTVEEIERAIKALPRKDFNQLRDWMQRYSEDEWDREFAEDAASGKLDSVAQQALAEYHSGRSNPFPPDEEPSNS